MLPIEEIFGNMRTDAGRMGLQRRHLPIPHLRRNPVPNVKELPQITHFENDDPHSIRTGCYRKLLHCFAHSAEDKIHRFSYPLCG